MPASGWSPGYHLLTGATGLLGRYLLRDLLLADVPVAVLVRPTRRVSAAQRMDAVMCTWDEQVGRPLPRPVVLQGDIGRPGLGLTADEQQWAARHCTTFIHNAASLSFQSTGPDSEPWLSNVQGTKHVLDFCRQAGLRKFHHVSTAYVCGLRSGRVLETELDVGQEPGNDYERSKIQAEQLVRGADFLDAPTFHRPSIIIGDAQTGYTTTFHGFYALLQLVHMLVGTMPRDVTGWARTVSRLRLDGYEAKNFVPVDWVSAVMAHIICRPEHHGKTYHLTPRHRVPARLFRDVVEEATQHYAVKFVGATADLGEMSDLERLFFDHIRVYHTYWRDDPIFDTTNTTHAAPHLPCPHVDRAMLMRLSRWAIDTNFGGTRERSTPPEFDPRAHLGPLVRPAPEADRSATRLLGLQVDGHGGGQWHLVWEHDRLVAADVGLHACASANFRLDVDTFAALTRGAQSPQQAYQQGALRITGNGLPPQELLALLQQVFQSPVGAPGQ